MPTPTNPLEPLEIGPASSHTRQPSSVAATAVEAAEVELPALTTGEKVVASRRRRQRRVPFVVRLWGAIRRGWASLLAAFASKAAAGSHHGHEPKTLSQRILAATPAWF